MLYEVITPAHQPAAAFQDEHDGDCAEQPLGRRDDRLCVGHRWVTDDNEQADDQAGQRQRLAA